MPISEILNIYIYIYIYCRYIYVFRYRFKYRILQYVSLIQHITCRYLLLHILYCMILIVFICKYFHSDLQSEDRIFQKYSQSLDISATPSLSLRSKSLTKIEKDKNRLDWNGLLRIIRVPPIYCNNLFTIFCVQ